MEANGLHLKKRQFVYFGISKGLVHCIDKVGPNNEIISIQLNVDGAPVSYELSCWPILCRIYDEEIIHKPFDVSIFIGSSHPKSWDNFFKKFIKDLNNLLRNGITINEKEYIVRVHCFICDRAARTYIKGIKGHVGFWSCERCNIAGEKLDQTAIFICENSCAEQTNETFRHFDNLQHHSERSPLLDIQPKLDMIKDFALNSMHLLDIGVVGVITDALHNGKPEVKMSLQQIAEANRRIIFMRDAMPSEFQRRIGLLTDSSQ